MWDYSDKVRDHYINPRNVGEIDKPDGIGEVGNITCGDALRFTFKLDASKKVIQDAKFKTFGCGSAIAAASMLTELVIGKTLAEAAAITNKDIADALGGLPKEKMHCSVMGQEALEASLNYYKTGGVSTAPVEKKEGTVVCTCFGITDLEIEKAIRENNLTTVDDVTHFTKAGGGCGGCVPEIESILAKVLGAGGEPALGKIERLTFIQKVDKIRTVIETKINPLLATDGGACELLDLEGNTAIIKFVGHCAGCALSGKTLMTVVEKQLQDHVSVDISVREG